MPELVTVTRTASVVSGSVGTTRMPSAVIRTPRTAVEPTTGAVDSSAGQTGRW